VPRGELVTPDLLRAWPLPEVSPGQDKAGRGEIHVVGGATETPGAVLLAGLAALRVGAGKLRITTVETTAVALAVAVPEALVSPQLAEGADAYVVGPGVLAEKHVVHDVLEISGDAAVVVDAACLHDLDDRDAALPARTVLTPNRAELEALGGDLDDPRSLAEKRGAVIVTHGWVAAPDGRLWRDEVGSPALGTSGSGDVLAGIVGGLLARGADPAQAAVWGQYLHGRAATRLGQLARDFLAPLPDLLAQLAPRPARTPA
jgi:hydroxyethylthiazole kinase-like uncharacterized protein yjeF